MKQLDKERKMPSLNAAVWRNGGSIPQKVQCEFGSLPPAGSSVNPRLREAAGTLSASGGQRAGGQLNEKIEDKTNYKPSERTKINRI
jgi:hypothetical protein